MVAIRSLFILSAAVGIASAGKCKPESRSSSVVSVPSSTVSASDTASSTASASATLIESSTTLADTTVETSLTESATETGSSATSADATETSTTESKPTTFLTSFTTSNADTTTEPAATTTSVAPGPVVTCPSEVDQCLGTMEIQCNVILSGLANPTTVADLNECAQQCNSETSCLAFTYSLGLQTCFKVTASQSYAVVNLGGWASGIKGTCSQSTEPSSTVFTSTAETTTTEAATTTTTLAPADPTCPSTVEQCASDSAVLCDVQLSDLQLAGFSNDILECASFCDEDDTCAGFSRVRSNGACFKAITLIAGVTQSDKAGWDSGIKGTCGQQLQPTTTAFTSTAETTTTEAATTTTAAAPVNNCPSETGQCRNGALIQCDVVLGDLSIAGISNDITECSQFCAADDNCRGFSRRRDTGACLLAFVDPDDVTQEAQEGWDSGIMNTCFS
ncbi:hypothetical protein Focb16_v008006 [Fusarium oxysporum f. sp. cubense]|uniref:Apple domain-containing protein n=1 Tax=Fusarium oxysporum f. sp. cubense TaxID=61366 RepID=A0A559LPM3_FUSOC|nr:hypothetical protein Focb16_v008006 [Fusarium oxysporum f. sp. cubense]